MLYGKLKKIGKNLKKLELGKKRKPFGNEKWRERQESPLSIDEELAKLAKLNTEEAKVEARKEMSKAKQIEETKKEWREYQRLLLEPENSERRKKILALQQIVEISKKAERETETLALKTLKSIFDPASFNQDDSNWKEQRKLCIYKLFVLFAGVVSSEGNEQQKLSNEVLEWLADEKVEETILAKDSVSMIHCLLLSNNLAGVRWCFDWYHRQQYSKQQIGSLVFERTDKQQKCWFNYLADGLAADIEGANYPQSAIIEVMLAEYEKKLKNNDSQGELFITEQLAEQKATIKELIMEKAELPFNLAEYFTTTE